MSHRTPQERHILPASSKEAGYVSAELALALPAVVLLLTLVLAASALMLDHIRCVDAARVAARAAARGDTASSIMERARQSAPAGADIDIDAGPPVQVTIVGPVRPLLPQELRARASVTAPSETVSAHRIGLLG